MSEACGVLWAWDPSMDTRNRGALFVDRFRRKLTATAVEPGWGCGWSG